MNKRMILTACAVTLYSTSVFADAKLDQLVKDKKYDDAISYANSSLSPQKRTINEWDMLAKAYLGTGNETRAIATYIIASRMNPKDGLPLAGVAAIYYSQKEYQKAFDNGKKAFQLTPNAETAWQYARAAIKLDKSVEAKAALEKVIAADPTNVSANSSLGEIYFDEKNYSKAASLLEVAYKNGPSQKLAYKIALSYKESGNNAKAKEYYELAISGNSKLYKAMAERAEIAFSEKDYEKAYNEYSRASKGYKLTANEQYQYAKSAQMLKKQDSYALFKKAVKLFGTNASQEALEARLIVADSAYSKKEIKTANSNYSFYLNKKGSGVESAPIYYRLAETQIALKQNDKAIVSLEKSIKNDPKYVDSYALLADLYTKAGNSEKAASTLEGLIKQNQSDPTVYLKLGNFKYGKKSYADALANYEKSFSLKPTTEASHGIALSADKLKKYDKVIPAAKSVLSKSDDVLVRKALVRALVATGDYQTAKTENAKILQKEPKNNDFWQLNSKIAEALKDTTLLLKSDSALITIEPKNIVSRKRYSKWLISQNNIQSAYPIIIELTKLEPKNKENLKLAFELSEKLDKSKDEKLYLEKYLALAPKDISAIITLGEINYGLKNFDTALSLYRKALSISSQPNGFPYEHYAKLVIKKGKSEEVITALNGVVKAGKADEGTYTTLGMLYKNKGNYDKAIKMYEEALALNPSDLAATIALGDCQIAKGDKEGATITYEQAAMMNPDSLIVYKKLGYAYEVSGNKNTAMDNYKKYIDMGGKSSNIAYKVGMNAYNQKDYKLASKALLKVKGNKATAFDTQLKLAISLFKSEEYDKAVVYINKVLKRNPKVATQRKLLKYKGESLEKLGKTKEALAVYDAFVVKKFSDKDVEYKRAYLREKTAPATAKKIYKLNIKRYPNDMRNYLQLGKMLSNSTNPSELKLSAQYLEKVLAKAGASDPELLLTVAEAYGKAGVVSKEIVAYQNYSKVKPDDISAYIKIGDLYMELGKYSEAALSYETASTLDPKNADLYVKIGESYVYQGDYKSALSPLETAVKMKPNDTEALKLLVDTYVSTGSKDKAKDILKKLVADGDPKYLGMYADFLIQDGSYDEAMKLVEDMLKEYDQDTQALLLKGKILSAQGKKNDAIEVLKYAIALDPYLAEADYELAKIYSTMGGAKKRAALMYYKKAVNVNNDYGQAWYEKALLEKLFKMNDEYTKSLKEALRIMPKDPNVVKEAKTAGILK